MYNLILILHILVAIGVISVILVQRGRSGGLIESLGGVESIFGTKTSAFFVKVTVVLAILFFVTSITLAYLAKQRGKSLVEKIDEGVVTQEALPEIEVLPEEETLAEEEALPAPEEPIAEEAEGTVPLP
jgi:preprotein translocase subunit SecG